METPIQELINHIETWMLDEKHVLDNPMKYEEYMVHYANHMVEVKEHFVRLCKTLLEKEKEVIIESHINGQSEWDIGFRRIENDKYAKKYYIETFETK